MPTQPGTSGPDTLCYCEQPAARSRSIRVAAGPLRRREGTEGTRGTRVYDAPLGGSVVAGYTALYRTWRPHRLADVIGQEHVTRTLRNAIRAGNTAHAYLFCGPRGTGKTSTARIVAAALNCLSPEDGDACGKCANCVDIAADRLVDVQEIDAASNRQVEDMRALRETVGYAPSAGRTKVYILDEVHMLTDASWNTLLKTLEEPPPATMFILCTTEARKVLATVVSRCQRFDFHRLPEARLTEHLARICAVEHIAAAPAALERIASHADGGARDALTILEQAAAYAPGREVTADDVADLLGTASDSTIEDLLAASLAGAAHDVFSKVQTLYLEGRDMGQILQGVLQAARDGLVATLTNPGGSPGKANAATYRHAVATLAAAEMHIRRAAQPRLVLEIALLALFPPANRKGATDATTTPSGAPKASTRPPERSSPVPALPPPTSVPDCAPTSASEAQPQWTAVLETIRHRSVPAYSILQDARFSGVTAGTLRLTFPFKGLAATAQRWTTLIADAWREHGGVVERVECGGGSDTPGRKSSPRSGQPTAAPRPEFEPRAREPEGTRQAALTEDSDGGDDTDVAFQRALALFEGHPLPPGGPHSAQPTKEG